LGVTSRNGIEKEVQRTVIVKLKAGTSGGCKRRSAKGCQNSVVNFLTYLSSFGISCMAAVIVHLQ
jgi:hypothetical protein